ncbi:hypothetical protein U9M48_041565 [Paspalum notatum var. saurae]|uniref:Rx N-terminal domain-containing protein n=1 Tax=Paspalum notatum var. saurae TaxID=547442 RepID=A0AAQ3UQR1_PASNO
MAELASGAVSSLLGVIRNEAALLGGVRGDVQFIKEEMESMNSFLLYLARTVPADGGEHDEQVRTWMNQVRLLASDCNNCIDLYLYRGNPEIHLPKDRFQRYLRWTPWFLQRMVAQHRAAVKLRELKDRARDVGERRLRYGVEVPANKALAAAAATPSSLPYAIAGAAAADDQDMDDQVVATAADHSGALLGLRVLELEDYFKGKLAEWIQQAGQGHIAVAGPGGVPSVAIVAPEYNSASDVARQVLALTKTHFQYDVLVDIPAVHFNFVPLEPVDVLCYIWRDLSNPNLRSQSSKQATTTEQQQQLHWRSKNRRGIYYERIAAIRQIKQEIRDVMKVHTKIQDIKTQVRKAKDNVQLRQDLKKEAGNKELKSRISEQPLPVLLHLLLKSAAAAAAAAAEQGQPVKKATTTLATWYDKIVEITSTKLKRHMEVTKEEAAAAAAAEQMIQLDDPEAKYQSILKEVFPKNNSSQKPLQAEPLHKADSLVSTAALGEEQIKAMIQKAKQEILDDMHKRLEAAIAEESMVKIERIQEDQQAATEEITEKGGIPEDDIAEITIRIDKIKQKIEELMKIKRILDKIQSHLEDRKTMVVLKIHETGWEETRNTFNLLGCVGGAVVITTLKSTQQAKEYCNPPREPMEYSLLGLYHDIVLQLTRKQMKQEGNDPNSQIFREILEECEPHEFCMKIFAHALYAMPKRSTDEMRKLHNSLKAVLPKSFGGIANKMLKFSYNDLQKEYKSCLLYLAIFPPGYKIRRSTLIGRWVVEGLITTEDWRWSSSVRKANKCFDELIDRWLLYPTDISATGEIKSCMVGDRVHEFITKIAEKQQILETRLSRHLARHFSITNDLRLRGSDKIEDDFLKKLSESSRFYLLKVLDLEGCYCFGKKSKPYLKDICCKIKLLKFLSLRRTDVAHLPNEINNLHELEVLDIRQTQVPTDSTRNLCLLKLKRLLAGHMDQNNIAETISVDIPEKVEKMEGMEVLSSVKPRTCQDLEDIGKLWQLRKLGVVIENNDSHLNCLIQGISDLTECIQSLSITIVPSTGRKETLSRSRRWLLPATNRPKFPPKVLKSLTIRGTTQTVPLLPFLAKENHQLTKVTLCNTLFNDLDVLAELPNLCCVKLQHGAYNNTKLDFKKTGFRNLKYFFVEDSNITCISFDDESVPLLEKIVMPLSDGLKLSGVDKLPRLEEFELNNKNNKSNNNSDKGIKSSGNNNGNDTNSTSITSATTITTMDATTSTEGVTPAAGIPVAPNTDSANAAANTAIDTNAVAAPAAAAATAHTTNTTTAAATNAITATPDGTAPTPTDNNSSTTNSKNMLHSLLDNATRIVKLTLRGTMLKQGDLQILAMKQNIRILLLLDKSYEENQLTFNNGDFPNLNLLIVEYSNITKISFEDGSCPKLEKFIWTFTKMDSLAGIGNLKRLKEVQFNGESVRDEVKKAINNHRNKPYFTHYKPENKDQQPQGNLVEPRAVAKCSCF